MKNIILLLFLSFAAMQLCGQSINGQRISKMKVKTAIDSADHFLYLEGTYGNLSKAPFSLIYNEGSYTPTWAAVANLGTITGTSAYYSKLANSVLVWGSLSVNPNVDTTNTAFTMTLPYGSALTAAGDLAGVAVNDSLGVVPIAIYGDVAGNRALFKYRPGLLDTTAKTYYFSYTYRVK